MSAPVVGSLSGSQDGPYGCMHATPGRHLSKLLLHCYRVVSKGGFALFALADSLFHSALKAGQVADFDSCRQAVGGCKGRLVRLACVGVLIFFMDRSSASFFTGGVEPTQGVGAEDQHRRTLANSVCFGRISVIFFA